MLGASSEALMAASSHKAAVTFRQPGLGNLGKDVLDRKKLRGSKKSKMG